MATITPGTGGTLKSSAAESALIELAVYLRNNQAITANNPSAKNYVSVDFSGSSYLANISFSIPAIATIDNQGRLLLAAEEYLSNLSFSAGTGGTFKSDNAAQTLIEIASYLQNKEADETANINQRNYVTSQYNADDNLISGTASIPISFTINNSGNISVAAVPYLQ